MTLIELKSHLQSCPGLAGATRASWKGSAYVTLGSKNGWMYLVVGDQPILFGVTFEDAMADDWEPV